MVNFSDKTNLSAFSNKKHTLFGELINCVTLKQKHNQTGQIHPLY